MRSTTTVTNHLHALSGQSVQTRQPAFARVLLTTWVVTAVWDGLCASALAVLAYRSTFSALWSGVAATALGGPRTPTLLNVALGLLVHSVVALVWSAVFVWVVYQSTALRRTLQSWYGLVGVAAVFGPLIWLVMSLGVIPVATGRTPALGMRWWVQLVAHVPFVTVPMAIAARTVMYSRGTGSTVGETLSNG